MKKVLLILIILLVGFSVAFSHIPAFAVTCWDCNGSGSKSCGWCGGDGIKDGRQCGFCNGRGTLSCFKCGGSGSVDNN